MMKNFKQGFISQPNHQNVPQSYHPQNFDQPQSSQKQKLLHQKNTQNLLKYDNSNVNKEFQGGGQGQKMFNNFMQSDEFEDPFGDDEDGFAKKSIFESNNLNLGGFGQSIDDDPLFENLGAPGQSAITSQQMLIMDDFNKIHNNFAGYTFSQISSTYEVQTPLNQNNANQQQSQNDQKQSKNHSKLYDYKEKNKSKSQNKTNQDELLDSDILNNSNDELNSPKDPQVQNLFQKGQSSNLIMDFQPSSQAANNPNFFYKQQSNQNDLPSYQSNINLNNIIMNSENLQQSITSTMTIYNSAVFDDASILRVLDKTTISDESSIFVYQENDAANKKQQQQQSSAKTGLDLEQNFKFESEDVKLILTNLSTKFKEKLQKTRLHHNSTHSQTQFVALSIDEIKQFEILSTSAIEKIRQISSIGKQIIDHTKLRNLQFKNQKQNLKIHIHKEIQKFKDLCKRQYKQAEHQRFKNQIQDFEWSQKIQALEERIEKQAEEINRLANKNEQLKYEKSLIVGKNEQKMSDLEKIIGLIIENVKDGSGLQGEKNKVNKSFCVGNNHAKLLQTKISQNRARIINQQDLQQSVDEKENESFLSNKASSNNQNNTIKTQLDQLRKVVKDYKLANQQFRKDLRHQQEVGSYQDSSSIQNILSNFHPGNNGLLRDSLIQQSQFIPEESQASMNRAFIQPNDSSNQSQSEDPLNQAIFGTNITEEDDHSKSIYYNFDEGHILVVMDGQQKQGGQCDSDEGLKIMDDLSYLDDKIMPDDLKGGEKQRVLTDTQKIVQQQQRDIVLKKRVDKNHGQIINSSGDNSIEDDLNILKNLDSQNEKPQRELKKMNMKQELQFFNDLSGIDQNDSLFSKNGFQPDLNNGSGKLIFIEDEMNSRNDNGILYSGGSSLISLNQAFNQSQKFKNSHRIGMLTLKVQEREIKIPRLNLARIAEDREPFQDNIPFTGSSSEMTESVQTSQVLPTHHQVSQQQNDPSSFQNDSIKLFKDNIEKSLSSIGGGTQGGDLDKAVYIQNTNQSKFLNSQQSIEKSNESKKQGSQKIIFGNGGGNLLDSFKEELQRMDQQKSSSKDQKAFITNEFKVQDNGRNTKQNLLLNQDTLDLDDISLIHENQNDNSKHKNIHNEEDNDDKTIDLSHNASRFKKSQSDSNLLFNDVDLEENLHDKSRDDKGKEKQEIKQNIILNFKKIKTPQGSQNFVKFKIPKNDSQQEKDNNLQQQVQKPIGSLILHKNRSRSGQNPNNNNQNTNTQQNPSQLDFMNSQDSQINPQPLKIQSNQNIMKALKNLKIKNQVNQSQVTEDFNHNHGRVNQSQITAIDTTVNYQGTDVNNTHLVNQSMVSDSHNTSSNLVMKKVGGYKLMLGNPHHKRREQLLQNHPSDQTDQSNQSVVLMQNYNSASAVIGHGQTSQGQRPVSSDSKSSKQTKNNSLISIKKAQFNAQLEQIKESDAQLENTQYQPHVASGGSYNMMQQMKEFQESYDMSMNNKGQQKNMSKQNIIQDEESVCISPNRNQRTSQSCTPQKKNMIVVSKQFIKANTKVNFIKNLQPSSDKQQQENPVIKKIAIAKRIFSKQGMQNLSVLNASVDQSQLHDHKFQGGTNESQIVNADSSMMHDIQPVVKLQAAKIIRKKIVTQSQSQGEKQETSLNKNLQNIAIQQPSQQVLNPAQISAKLNRQIIKTVKTQQKLLSEGNPVSQQSQQQSQLQNYYSNPNPSQPSQSMQEQNANESILPQKQMISQQQKVRRDMLMQRLSNNNSGQGKV